VHLNPNVREVVLQQLADIKNLHMMAPVDFEASLYLQSRACLILTDSGGIQEESPSFGVPCVVMRQHTERAEGIATGFAHLAGTETAKIVQLAEDCLTINASQILKGRENPYGDGKSSKRVVDRLMADTNPSGISHRA
jgi:UDP-N-acetylglucosamine 2-epimerase (non-hydrolysing)